MSLGGYVVCQCKLQVSGLVLMKGDVGVVVSGGGEGIGALFNVSLGCGVC